MPTLHERVAKPSKKKSMKTQFRSSGLTESAAPSWDRFPGIMDEMPLLAAEYLALNTQAAEIEQRKKEIREWCEAKLLDVGEPIIQGDFFVTETITSHRPKKLSPERLLGHGVKLDVINGSYEGGDAYTYVKISLKE